MATSGTLQTSAYVRNSTNYSLVFSWSQVSQSTANNTTTISWTLKTAKDGDNSNLETGPVRLTVDGAEWWYFATNEGSDSSYEDEGENTGGRISHGDGVSLASGTYTFTHNSDGTKSFTVDLRGTCYIHDNNLENPNMVGTQTFTLNTINRNYTVTYNANGGSGAPAAQTKVHGTALTLTSSVPTGKTYTLTFNKGTDYVNTVTIEESDEDTGQTVTVSTTYPDDTMPDAATGKCKFSHWNTKADGSGTSYSSGGSYTANADVVLYAIWISPSVTIPVVYPERDDGVSFSGWSSTLGGSATYSPGDVVTLQSNYTLYAVWDVPSYTVTFNLSGGSYSGTVPLTQIVSHGGDATAPEASKMSKENKKFQGWLGQYTDVQANTVVFAMWDTCPIWVMTDSGWAKFGQ